LQPDIVVLDLMMPDMDGWQVCQAIRSFSEVPILVLSAMVNSEAVSRAMQAGANDYLVKPAPLHSLTTHLRKLIGE
jgi:DNA-binding response OmpR family regulator